MKPNKNTKDAIRILIAEDSPTQAAQLRHLLEERGYAVVTARDGKEALASARQRKPALIISDVMMPEIDGYGLCKAIKSDDELKDVPVMLVTSLSDSQDVIRGLECGADNFVRKPYDGDYLLSRIEYLLMNLELRKNHKMEMALEINLGGQKHVITSERQQILDLLISTYEQAVNINNELRQREQELANSNKVLQGLHRIAEGLNQAVSLREVCEMALDRAMELPGVRAGWVQTLEGESEFRTLAARNLPPALSGPEAFEGSCVCRRKLLSGEFDQVTNILECERLGKAKGDTQGLRYHASVPLWTGGRIWGVMNLVGPDKGMFGDEVLKVLYGVGHQVAVALERAELHEHLEKLVAERTAKLVAEVEQRKRIQEAQARLVAIIEATPDMVATAGLDGRVIYCNPAGLRMLGSDSDLDLSTIRILDTHPEWAAKLVKEEAIPHAIEHGTWSGETALLRPDGREIPISQVIIAHKGFDTTVAYLSTIARDISLHKEHEAKIVRLSRMHAVLSSINTTIVRVREQQELYDEVCRIAVEQGKFGLAWIGLFDPATLDVTPVAWAGIGTENLKQHKTTVRADVSQGQGYVGRAIRERKPAFTNDIEPGVGGTRLQEMRRLGYHSLISLPLVVEDKAVGSLSLFAKEPDFFTDEEIGLMSELSGNVSFALDLIQKSEALADSEKKLDNILSTLREVVWSMDPHSGRILYVNAAVEQMTRRAVREFLAQPRLWRRMVHRDDRASMRRSIRRLLKDGSLTHKFRIVLANGDVRTVESSAHVRRDDAGKAVRIDGTLSDITERVRAEELQREHYSLARLQGALATAANEAVTVEAAFQSSLKLISDHGGWRLGHMAIFAPANVKQYSATASLWRVEDRARFAEFMKVCERFDYASGKQLVGRVIAEKIPVWIEDLAVIGAGPRKSLAVAAGLHCAFAFPVVVQNEVAAVIELYAEDARPADPLLIENITIITAQLARVLERARASEGQNRLAAIVASSQDAIMSSTPDGTILTWNAGAEKMFGYTREEILGQNLTLMVPEDLRQGVQQRRQRHLSGGKFEPYESERLTKDQRRLAVSVNVSSLKDDAGKVIGVASIYRDITERKQAETALRRLNDDLEDKVEARTVDLQRARHEAEAANSAKSSFLATMSHEIRTPMNGVVGMIDVLHQTSLRGDQVEMVDLIRESAFSLLGIINDILDFSKIEAGKLEIEHEAFAVMDVVEGVCSLLNSMAEKKGVILTLFTDPAIPAQVLGDALRLRQVLVNLVNNAIKFCGGQPHAGRVSLRALLVKRSPERVTVEFRVTDNGIGMDDVTQARLFTAFTQADATTTRRFGGTGLGLAIVKQLVALKGGEITVQSAPGEGATFKVHLPFALLPVESDVAEPASEVAGLTCMVVGAQGGLADDLAAYLKHAHAQVERVPSLASARQQRVSRSGQAVWIVDASAEPQTPEQIHAAARAQIDQDVRLVVVLIERGKRRRPRVVTPGLLTVDSNCLSRRSFLKTVAVAAGRASLEAEAEVLTPGKLAAIAPSREEAVRCGRLILVAEDNETNQKVIVRQLALLGYTADVAADGLEALERWHSGDYALLLTDLHMPQMDGYELTQAIRAEEKDNRRLPIIALTANALKGEAEHCRAAGMDDYRSKPSPLAELKAVLEKWMPVARPEPDASALSGLPTPASAQAATLVPVDVNVLKALVGDDPDIVREFLHDFRNSAARITVELRAACATSQMTAAVAAAHKLKSSARSVGAFALGELCEAMEEAGKADEADALAVLLPRFETQMAAVEDYLNKLQKP